MADNVAVTAGTGTTVAADEVVDGTLGTVKVQYVKLMDGTLDGTTKAAVSANGVQVQQATAANLNATVVGTGTFAVQAAATLAAETTKVIGTVNNAAGTNIMGKVGIDQTTPGTTNKVSIGTDGTVNPQTAANWALGAFAAAMPVNGQGIGLYDGTNMVRAKGDETSGLWVNIKAGAGSGGTAIADEAAFTEGTTSLTPIGGVYKTSHTALTTGQAGALALSAAREAMTLGKIWDGTTTVPILAASSGAPAATVPAIPVSLRDVNANGRAVPGSSAPVVLNSMTYKAVAASATATLFGATGASGDYLDGVLIIPATAAAGAVSITDGSGSAITIFAGGGTTALPTLAPFFVPIGAISSGGAGGWKVTTGTNVSVIGIGNFT